MSFSFRKIGAVMFGMFAHHDQIEDRQTVVFIRERANLISFGAEFPNEAVKQIGGASLSFGGSLKTPPGFVQNFGAALSASPAVQQRLAGCRVYGRQGLIRQVTLQSPGFVLGAALRGVLGAYAGPGASSKPCMPSLTTS